MRAVILLVVTWLEESTVRRIGYRKRHVRVLYID